jgi:fatty acid-binding protein DegV
MTLIDDIKRDPMEVHLSDARQIAAALIAAQVLVDALDANAPIDQIDTALAAYRKAIEAQT